MQRLFPLFLLLLLAVPGRGQDPSRHQVRLGWGDMLFETIAFHPSSTHRYPAAPQTDYPLAEKRDLGYTGHDLAFIKFLSKLSNEL